jgi:DNA polymerase I - 3''-5'' exonuclease and polymerase domains
MLDPIKNRRIGEAEVREKFGVGPDKVVDVQALAGDSTDNVPGVPGIGIKTAAELINTYGDLDSLLNRAGEIKQPKRREALIANAALARTSRELVRLRDDMELPAPLEDFVRRELVAEVLLPFLSHNQFRSTLARMEARLAMPASDALKATEAGAPPPVTLGESSEPLPAGLKGAHAYVLVQDIAGLDEWIASARRIGAVAFDTATTSHDAMLAELIGVSLALEPGVACYVPLAHKGGDGDLLGAEKLLPGQIPMAEALARLKPLLEDDSVLKIGQNIKYDMEVMARLGIAIAGYDDSMLISYVLGGGAHGHERDELSEVHLGHKTISLGEVAGTGKGKTSFDRVALEKARDYAAEDADVTLQLHRSLKPRLLAERLVTVYETIDRPLVPVVAAMEMAGSRPMPASSAGSPMISASGWRSSKARSTSLRAVPSISARPSSWARCCSTSSARHGKKGKTGAYATGADVLEELAAQGHDLPLRVLDWRQLSKLKSTYADALVTQINPATGRVHTSFALAATSTGRISSNDPNLQNIPVRTEEGRKIRGAFVAEPGHKLLSVDYSQIELRLAAHMAEVEPLKQAFREGYRHPCPDREPGLRRAGGGHGSHDPAQGQGDQFRHHLRHLGLRPRRPARHSPRRGQDLYRCLFREISRDPGLHDPHQGKRGGAGYVTTLFGRRCHVPGIADKNPARRSFMERAAINAPIQGTAADIIKRAMIRIPAALASAKLQARMLLQVHDELVFEVPIAEVEATGQVVRKVMEGAALPALALSVPLVADIGVGDNWAQAH